MGVKEELRVKNSHENQEQLRNSRASHKTKSRATPKAKFHDNTYIIEASYTKSTAS